MIQSEAVDPKINIHTGLVIKHDELHKLKVPSIKHGWDTMENCSEEFAYQLTRRKSHD